MVVGTNESILTTQLAGLSLRNPVLLAAGTAGVLDELWSDEGKNGGPRTGRRRGPLDLSRVGGVVTKSITPEPREGNDTWRIIESRAGMLNAIGLANPGIAAFDEHIAPRAAGVPTTVIGSAAGFSIDDYVRVAACMDEWAEPGFSRVARVKRSSEEPSGDRDSAVMAGGGAAGGTAGIQAIELNVSCPNVRTGLEFGLAPEHLLDLMRAVRPVVRRAKLLVKLSPATPSIVNVARAAIDGGADALTLGNTYPAMAIDVHTRRPRLSNVTGGLSGPGLHPIAVRIVHEVYRKLAKDRGVPIIGTGGVMRWEDAAEFILAGASAVQMGTALFVDPRSPLRVIDGLAKWVRKQGCSSIAELVGAAGV